MRGVETALGPEMKSTGEVLGIDETYAGALHKGFVGAGIRLPREGGRVLVSISDEEKRDAVDLMRRLVALGHTLVATPGTYDVLTAHGIAAERVHKIGAGTPDVLAVIQRRTVDLVINDFRAGRGPTDNYRIRRAAVEASIASLTSLDTAHALVTALESEAGPPRSLQEYQATHREALAT
jgi:carbamoyl-phosphate synthase large subunit